MIGRTLIGAMLTRNRPSKIREELVLISVLLQYFCTTPRELYSYSTCKVSSSIIRLMTGTSPGVHVHLPPRTTATRDYVR